MSERIEILKQKISVLPETPGVYQYFNNDGKIIYVGKSKKDITTGKMRFQGFKKGL